MLLNETLSTFTRFETNYPDPDPVGNLSGSDPKKIRKNLGIRPDPNPCAPQNMQIKVDAANPVILIPMSALPFAAKSKYILRLKVR